MQPEDASFSQRVFHIVAAIPYGKVTTYGEVARLAGSPRAALGWRRAAAFAGRQRAALAPGDQPARTDLAAGGGFSTATAGTAGGRDYFRPAQHGRFRALRLALVKQNSLWPKRKGC